INTCNREACTIFCTCFYYHLSTENNPLRRPQDDNSQGLHISCNPQDSLSNSIAKPYHHHFLHRIPFLPILSSTLLLRAPQHYQGSAHLILTFSLYKI